MTSTAIQSAKCIFRHTACSVAEPHLAVEELNHRIGLDAADAVVLFVSADYSLDRLAQILRNRVKAPVLCCTTAGEISSLAGYRQGSMVAATIRGCQAKMFHFHDLSRGNSAIDAAVAQVRSYIDHAADTSRSHLGLFVIDGLCRREESLIHRLQSAMQSIPVVGGSAGDSGQFKQTLVYEDGRFACDSAALMLLSGEFTAIPFQTHHFSSTGVRTAATMVDEDRRLLIRLDDTPARKRLADLLGCPDQMIKADWMSTRPLMLKRGDELFVRSVGAVNADGSLATLCAIQKGEILHIGKAGEITDTTASCFDALRHQQSTPDLVLGFDCILRRRELELRGRTQEMNRVLRSLPFVGFSTFGEQFNGLHINQTMTGVAIWNH